MSRRGRVSPTVPGVPRGVPDLLIKVPDDGVPA